MSPDTIPLWFAVPFGLIMWGIVAWQLVTAYHRRREYRRHLDRMTHIR